MWRKLKNKRLAFACGAIILIAAGMSMVHLGLNLIGEGDLGSFILGNLLISAVIVITSIVSYYLYENAD